MPKWLLLPLVNALSPGNSCYSWLAVVTICPTFLTYAQVAQLVEQRTENPRVAGSIPALGTPLRLIQAPPYFSDIASISATS